LQEQLVARDAGATSEESSVARKTRGASDHLDSRRSLFVVAGLVTLASVIVSAAVAAAVATSLSTGEGASDVRPPSMNFNAIASSLEERRLDSDHLSGTAGVIANVSELEGEAEALCLDAAQGEMCHRLVVWAMEDGLRLHPNSFTGLTRASPFHAFQQAMHRRNPEFCPPPCMKDVVPTAHPAALAPLVSTHGSYGSCNYGHADSAPGHAGCFVVHKGRLLTEKLTYDGMRYDIPGGQTDWKEPARCTAHREVFEETGYNVAPREMLAVVRNNFRIYRCELVQRHPIGGHDHEISWVGWMSPGEIRDKVRRGQFRFPEAARYADWVR